MSVVVRFSVPADAFGLGDVLAEQSGVRIRFESVIPTGEATIPYLWVSIGDADVVETALRGASAVDEVRAVDEVDGETLVRVRWSSELDGLIDAIDVSDAVILYGEGEGDSWSFRVRFPDHTDLSAFYHTCAERGIPVDIAEVHDPIGTGTDDGVGLTDEQRTALRTALAEGYFAVPRGTTLVDLADELGVSDSAVSQRLRRGLATLLAATLRSESAGTGDGPDD